MKKDIRLFFQYLCFVIKVILFFWILFPIFCIFSMISSIKSKSFLKKEKITSYLNRHRNEIKDLGNSRIRNLEIERIRKGVSNLVWKQSFTYDGGKKITLVGKKFLPFGSIITFISSYLGPWPTGIPISINSRFRQELEALSALKSDGVHTPEVVFIDEREKLFLMEYIPGIDSGDFLENVMSLGKMDEYLMNFFHNCGNTLALLHRHGISLISHNDRSRILRENGDRIYFVDFELSTSKDYRAWDPAIFIHWIRIKLKNIHKYKIHKIEQFFIEGYKALEPLPQAAIDRHLEGLRIYIPFVSIGQWINRRLKHRLKLQKNG